MNNIKKYYIYYSPTPQSNNYAFQYYTQNNQCEWDNLFDAIDEAERVFKKYGQKMQVRACIISKDGQILENYALYTFD